MMKRISDGPPGKTGSLNCAICNFIGRPSCEGYYIGEFFVHGTSPIPEGFFDGPYVHSVERCPDCLEYSCRCHRGTILDLSESEVNYWEMKGWL